MLIDITKVLRKYRLWNLWWAFNVWRDLKLQIYSVLADTLLSASDILGIFPLSLLSCAEWRAEESYFFCNDRYLKMVYYFILYSNALWYFPQVLNNYKANKIDDIQHTNFPIAFPTFGCHPISQYSSLTGLHCKYSNPSSLFLAAFLIRF